jgi:hypothetical protein
MLHFIHVSLVTEFIPKDHAIETRQHLYLRFLFHGSLRSVIFCDDCNRTICLIGACFHTATYLINIFFSVARKRAYVLYPYG